MDKGGERATTTMKSKKIRKMEKMDENEIMIAKEKERKKENGLKEWLRKKRTE